MKPTHLLALFALVPFACTSTNVTIVAPEDRAATNCFDSCEQLFGVRPTINCGERTAPGKALLCSYDHWERTAPSTSPLVSASPPTDTCRAACARDGFTEVETCWMVPTKKGPPAVACQYKTGAH